MKEDTKALIQNILTQEFAFEPGTTSIFATLGSLQIVDLILRLEEQFKIEIQPIEYDAAHFQNLETLTIFVNSKL